MATSPKTRRNRRDRSPRAPSCRAATRSIVCSAAAEWEWFISRAISGWPIVRARSRRWSITLIDQAQRIEANEYFAREADTLAQLKHQAIPAITDRFELANRHYLVMEYVEGRNLEEELAVRGEPLPEGLVIDIARQLCDVLVYLHGLVPPIIYRDMKPSNVMLQSNGRVVLVDFGIARLFKAARKGTMIGTLGFAPPEQYQGLVDPRSDIYSLGATLHYVLTGRGSREISAVQFPAGARSSPGGIEQPGRRDRCGARVRDGRAAGAHPGIPRHDALWARPRHPARQLDQRNRRTVRSSINNSHTRKPPLDYGKPRSRLSRSIGLVILPAVLGGAAFGGTYLYSNPELQLRLGLKPLFDGLPWKHEELLAKARDNPLEFSTMTLALSTREGNALAPPQSKFNDTDLTNARYLKWTATFKRTCSRDWRGATKKSRRDSTIRTDCRSRRATPIFSSGRRRRPPDFSGGRADADDDRQAARHLQGGALLGRQNAHAGKFYRQSGPEREERGRGE